MRIHAIETGQVRIRPHQPRGAGPGVVRRLRPMLDRDWLDPLPILAWAIEHSDGLIVVDTGETARAAAEPGYFPSWHPYFRRAVAIDVTPEEEIGPRLRALGLDPADARWVVMTHLHTDHAGGLHHFRNADIRLDAAELKAASGLRGRLGGYLPNRWPSWFDPGTVAWERRAVGPFETSARLVDGVTLLPTPGHTPGHLSVLVEDGPRRILLAGDVTYSAELLAEGVVDGVAPSARRARESMRRVTALDAVVLPTHDPGSVARLRAAQAEPTSGAA